ncbi:MAG: VWA domain-containing protein [Ruminococcaceae bacterium]|nr:VWA domain-containing protein [Oscillospiraceae bacterium]
MTNLQLHYNHPWLLLLMVPAVLLTLIPYFRMAKKYRRTRNRVISIVLHMLAMFIGINLLAGVSFSYEIPNEDNRVLLLVDMTESNGGSAEAKDEFVQSVINICDKEYRLGIVKFGFDQKYVVKFDDDTSEVSAYERYLASENPDVTATDIASALKYAAELFGDSKSGKIVLISDGIETDSTATSVIKAIAAEGIKVDTVHFPNPEHDEVQILSVEIPEESILLGEEFLLRLTLRSNLGSAQQMLVLRAYDNGVLLGENPITMEGEEQVIPIGFTLSERGMHELRFEIFHSGDTVAQNNSYLTYVNLQTFENILLIEKDENESEKLQGVLKDLYNVTALSIEEDFAQIPKDLRSMADYEQVILVNVAYQDMPAGFEELLNRYVYELGGGLFTVGGNNDMVNGSLVPHAYNRTDLANSTYYKQMLPVNAVDFTPPIAVMIVVDASASMSMGKLEAAMQGAEACLDTLNDRDFCGVMSFQNRATENLGLLPVSKREEIREAIQSLDYDSTSGSGGTSGGTVFSDPIMRAGRALALVDNVERKHIIIVTDGNPGDSYEEYLPYIENNMKDQITMSIVTVGDIDTSLKEKMDKTAEAGGGKFYNIKSAELHTIPTIMQQDLALEAIAEIAYGEEFIPTVKDRTTVLSGVDETAIPPLTGYYGTVAKKDAAVVLMGKYVPIYAQWKYGKGNVGSFMSDLNGEWSETFVTDVVGQAIIVNIVNSIFPMEDVTADDTSFVLKSDNYTNTLNVYGVADEHRVQVTVKPLSESLSELTEIPVTAAESNRRFTFVIKDSGLYEIRVVKLNEAGVPIAESVFHKSFSYSKEYDLFPERRPLGEELLTLLAQDGKGMKITDPAEVFASFAKTLEREYDPRIPLLIIAIVAVLLDIAVRKFKFKWIHELVREHKQKKADNDAKG